MDSKFVAVTGGDVVSTEVATTPGDVPEVSITSTAGLTQTKTSGPLGQFQVCLVKPLVRFLTVPYLRAQRILQLSRTVHVFHMQSVYIARQAIHLVITLNDLVDVQKGPDDEQYQERIDLEDDLIELSDAMQEWGANPEEGLQVDYDQGLHKINHQYEQFFKERFYFHNARNSADDFIYGKLVAYDQKTIDFRKWQYLRTSSSMDVDLNGSKAQDEGNTGYGSETYIESVRSRPESYGAGVFTRLEMLTLAINESSSREMHQVRRETPMPESDVSKNETATPLEPHGQPPAFAMPEAVPVKHIAEEPELDLRFNITGFVKDIQRVGETYSSNIFKGTYKHGPVAVKALRNPGGVSFQTIRQRFYREFVVWRSLNHPHILPLFGYTEDNGDFGALISPWYNNGDMAKHLGAGTCSLSLEKRMELVDQVTSALVYLHGLHPAIVHGDLKPGNVLLDDLQRAQLCDFGLSRLISEVSTGATTSTAPLGTIRYIAPELMYNSDQYVTPAFPSTESDVYALASVAYEFIYLQSPYHQYAHAPEILRAIYRGEPPAIRTILHPSDPFAATQNNIWDLLDQSWSRVPSDRPYAIRFRESFGQIMRIHKRNTQEPAQFRGYPPAIQRHDQPAQ